MSVDKREQLVRILRKPKPTMRDRLEQYKRDGARELDRPDFLWHFLLQSFATMGNSRGWQGLIGNQARYVRVTFEALAPLSPADRVARLEETLAAAGVRMTKKKARWLAENFTKIEAMGGLAAAKREALAQSDASGKIAFMKQFAGIGDKYARNIWMDVYHPDFRNTIAIDERIKTISHTLGVTLRKYDEHERFYQELARDAGLEPWELDRLLYNFRDEILRELSR